MNFTVGFDDGSTAALLFEGADLAAINDIAELGTLFPAGYTVHKEIAGPAHFRYGEKSPVDPVYITIVSGKEFTQRPDLAGLDSRPIEFWYNKKQYTLNLRERFNNCLSLFKNMSCGRCPERGLSCFSEDLKFEIIKTRNNYDIEELDTLVKDKTIGTYEYVSPSHTRRKTFAKRYRRYDEHRFADVEANIKDGSRIAYRSAETRGFKRTQCNKCVISDNCTNARHCKGAYPPELEIIEQCNAELGLALKNSDLPEWQIWELAHKVDLHAKHSRWNIVLCGPQLKNGKFVPKVRRALCSIDEYRNIETYDEIADVFDLSRTEADTKHPLVDKKMRAIWWLALNALPNSDRYGRFDAIGCGFQLDQVFIRWAHRRYLGNSDGLTEIDHIPRLIKNRLSVVDKIPVR